MKNPTNISNSHDNSRPENCISTALSDPPAKNRPKSKKNPDATANEAQNQIPKIDIAEPLSDEPAETKGPDGRAGEGIQAGQGGPRLAGTE